MCLGVVEEYEVLDKQLDQLNVCLDVLESQNDDLNSRIRDILEKMRQSRKESLKEESESQDGKK